MHSRPEINDIDSIKPSTLRDLVDRHEHSHEIMTVNELETQDMNDLFTAFVHHFAVDHLLTPPSEQELNLYQELKRELQISQLRSMLLKNSHDSLIASHEQYIAFACAIDNAIASKLALVDKIKNDRIADENIDQAIIHTVQTSSTVRLFEIMGVSAGSPSQNSESSLSSSGNSTLVLSTTPSPLSSTELSFDEFSDYDSCDSHSPQIIDSPEEPRRHTI